jgi:hypothetical protein
MGFQSALDEVLDVLIVPRNLSMNRRISAISRFIDLIPAWVVSARIRFIGVLPMVSERQPDRSIQAQDHLATSRSG